MEAHGLRGDLYCLIFSGDAEWAEEISELSLKSKYTSEFENFKIEKLKFFKKGFIVKLQSFNDRNKAELYKGAELWVSSDVYVSKDGEALYLSEILHFKIIDQLLGVLGTVEDFSSNGSQDLLIIDYKNKKVEIPFVKSFVTKIDFKKQEMHVNLPEGLLEINDEN